jgi:phosphoglycerate dehydrogenase-like enzyme
VQLLLAKSAFDRIAPRLKAAAPDLDVVTIAAPDTFERNGQTVTADQVDPDLMWVSADGMRAGLLPTYFGAALKGTKTKWAQLFVAGLDNPAFKQLMAKGIRLSKSSAQSVAIAEYVTGHAFSLIVPIDAQRAAQSKKEWKPTQYREISQTRWTLVGFGAIGGEIAKRVKPFGAHLTVVRRQTDNRGLADAVVQQGDLTKVLPQSDVVVLACALNDETRHLANDAFFNAMKKDAILINIGRGGLVDSEALRRGLDRDQPGKAVLDVFDKEPLPADDWMWDHPKIRVSAHTSHFGMGTMGRGDDLFLENLRRYLAGEKLLNEATKAEVGL